MEWRTSAASKRPLNASGSRAQIVSTPEQVRICRPPGRPRRRCLLRRDRRPRKDRPRQGDQRTRARPASPCSAFAWACNFSSTSDTKMARTRGLGHHPRRMRAIHRRRRRRINLKVPHMGWNSLAWPADAPGPLFKGLPQGSLCVLCALVPRGAHGPPRHRRDRRIWRPFRRRHRQRKHHGHPISPREKPGSRRASS